MAQRPDAQPGGDHDATSSATSAPGTPNPASSATAVPTRRNTGSTTQATTVNARCERQPWVAARERSRVTQAGNAAATRTNPSRRSPSWKSSASDEENSARTPARPSATVPLTRRANRMVARTAPALPSATCAVTWRITA